MNLQKCTYIVSLVLAGFALVFSNMASAELPGDIARLSDISGTVSFSPAGENEWIYATYNRPLVSGDRLWADRNGLAELQLGTATIRIGANTSMTIINLDTDNEQFQLSQGTLYLRVWSIRQGQEYEVNTPNLAFTVNQPGEYRIDVDADENVTTISVRNGLGEVYGENENYLINAQSSCRFYGDDLNDYECTSLVALDDFDRWSFKRNNRMENAISARYISREIIGYEDLDNYGTWRTTPRYGQVWVPSNVSNDWAPYRNGHWSWINPWGWTWIDNQRWGFAPSHYGRWVKIDRRWCWVPPRNRAALYSPALVVFVGGTNRRSSEIAWFPIGPGEVYVPPYSSSRDYFINININNTVVDHTYVSDIYHNKIKQRKHMNRQIPFAVTGVSKTLFVQSRDISKGSVRMSKKILDRAKLTDHAIVAPVSASVIGEERVANVKPPEKALRRRAIAKTRPPLAPISFEKVQSKLAENPGKPLSRQEITEIKQSVPAAAEQIQVVNPTQAPEPVTQIKTEVPGGPEKQPSVEQRAPREKAIQEGEGVPPQPVSPLPTERSIEELRAPREVPIEELRQPVEVPQPPETRWRRERSIQEPESMPVEPSIPQEGPVQELRQPVEVPQPPEPRWRRERPIQEPERMPVQPPIPQEGRVEELRQPVEVPQPPEPRLRREQPFQEPQSMPVQPATPMPQEREVSHPPVRIERDAPRQRIQTESNSRKAIIKRERRERKNENEE